MLQVFFLASVVLKRYRKDCHLEINKDIKKKRNMCKYFGKFDERGKSYYFFFIQGVS